MVGVLVGPLLCAWDTSKANLPGLPDRTSERFVPPSDRVALACISHTHS